MESGGIFRTIIITALFVVLVCDYTTLIGQLYESVKNSTSDARPIFVESDENGGKTSMDLLHGSTSFREDKTDWDFDADVDMDDLSLFGSRTRTEIISIVQNACLPKLICELSSGANQHKLTENELSLLKLIRDTTLGTLAEVTSKYHFAAHMGQLISGTDGIGCHVFYSTCPLPGLQVLKTMRKLRIADIKK